MIIYTVKRGDSLYAIARRYGTSVEQLMFDNQIEDPQRLVIGQALVVGTDRVSHRVAQGESLYSIARRYGVAPEALYAANPNISPPYRIYPGQTVSVPLRSEPTRPVAVNGFTVSISDETLTESLPSLTYISPFAYQVDAQGALTPPSDTDVLIQARDERVAALMTVINAGPDGSFSSDVMHAIVTNQATQDAFIRNTLNVMTQKGYYGLVVDFEYVYPFDRESYNQLLRRLREILHAQGFILASCLAPKTSAAQPGTLYEGHDYRVHGEECDLVIIMTYEWGYTYEHGC